MPVVGKAALGKNTLKEKLKNLRPTNQALFTTKKDEKPDDDDDAETTTISGHAPPVPAPKRQAAPPVPQQRYVPGTVPGGPPIVTTHEIGPPGGPTSPVSMLLYCLPVNNYNSCLIIFIIIIIFSYSLGQKNSNAR